LRQRRKYTDYLRDMLDAAGKAGQFVRGVSFDEFEQNTIAGMRDKLAHEYVAVHLDRLWQTVERDLPPLEAALTAMPADLEGEHKSE
jgi:uncharacterized protein with HEPN domain